MNRNSTVSHLTVCELADRWQVSKNYVRRLIWDSKLPATRFGRAVRIPLEAVEKHVEENTTYSSIRNIRY